MRVGSSLRGIEGEEEAAADHQPVWEDARDLVERFTNTTEIIVEQPAVELRVRRLDRETLIRTPCVRLDGVNMLMVMSYDFMPHHDLQWTILDAASTLRAIRYHSELVHIILKTHKWKENITCDNS